MVFSTVLEINGNPTVYSVYRNGSMAFFSPSQLEKAPILYACDGDSSWTIKGTDDDRLMKQVLREIE
jgi:hypothetical protein